MFSGHDGVMGWQMILGDYDFMIGRTSQHSYMERKNMMVEL